MNSFWKVSRAVLRIDDDVVWRRCRSKIVIELTTFRMGSGGFLHEDYSTPNACEFWGVAGCHAPTLKELAFCLTPLPCSSSEAERNWMEVKSNMTKKRNRIDRAKVEKMVFVRRFTKLQRQVFQPDHQKNSGFSAWVKELLITAAKDDNSEPDDISISDQEDGEAVFNDYIEPLEQGRINGREPGQPTIPLTQLKKDNAAKSWLFEKYYNMCFVDKNPESCDPDYPPLPDEGDWEHRVVRNVVWWRHKGYALETALHGDPEAQSIERYQINCTLHQMIRESPHNTRPMKSLMERDDDDNDTDDDDTHSDDESMQVGTS